MAKKKPNKSAAIRDYLKEHPSAGPSEVMAALKEQKIVVSATHVSNVKSRIASGHEVGVRGVGRPRANAISGDLGADMVNLIRANQYANDVGGIDRGITYLRTLAKIKG